MESLITLIKLLTSSEVRGFRSYLKRQHSSKTLALFDLVLKSADTDKKKIAKKLYGGEAGPRLDMLSRRLEEKLGDYLVSDANLSENDVLDEYGKDMARFYKKFSQVIYLVYSKGAIPIVH